MPLAPAKVKEMKDMVALAKKRELSFGLCLGKKPEGTIIMSHKTKAPPAVGKQAKAEGETGQFSFGKMSVAGKEMTLNVEGKMLPGMSKKVRELMKGAGLSMKIIVLDPDGNAAEGEEDDAAQEEEANEETAAETPSQAAEEEEAATAASASNEEEEEEIQAAAGADEGAEEAPSGEMPPSARLGEEPEKRELTGEFAEVRQNLMRAMGGLDSETQAEVQDQIKQFGALMKARDFHGAQELMDDLSVAQEAVTEPQRGRARDEIGQMDNMVSDIETELQELEAALGTGGAS